MRLSSFVLLSKFIVSSGPCTRRFISTLPRPYKFHIGAAWAPKPPDASQPKHYKEAPRQSFTPGSPKALWRDSVLRRWVGDEEFVEKGKGEDDGMGEDFLFVEEMRGSSGVGIGIADGVGGWSASGVDPSIFSQAMMYHSSLSCARGWAFPPDIDSSSSLSEVAFSGDGWDAHADLGDEIGPLEIMKRGYEEVLNDKDVSMGASTACIMTLNAKTGRLRASNLGDSGFTILRGSNIAHVQPPQTHFFNCPKQLSKYSRAAFLRARRPILDRPSDADLFEITLKHGDVILLYSDGLSDNIFQPELLELSTLIQASGEDETEQAKRLAKGCVEKARMAMVDMTRLTPFELAAKQEGGWEWMDWMGGKIDDVTVIAVFVTEGM